MGVIRIEKNKNFTVMSNYHLRDKTLSLRARGLLSTMLSLPEEWDYSVNGLAAICLEGVKAVRSGLMELEEKRYLKRERIHTPEGRFDYQYTVYEMPQPCDPEPHTLKGHTVEGHTLNGTQINTDRINTDKVNTEKEIQKKESADALTSTDTTHVCKNLQSDSTKKTPKRQEVRHKYGEYDNVLLSDTELEKLKAEFPDDWEERIERVSGYVAQRGKGYSNYLATIRNWARRDAQNKMNQKKGFVYNDHCEEGDSL